MTLSGNFDGVVAACSRRIHSEGSDRASRRTVTHPPQLVGKGAPPAAMLPNGAQELDKLSGLLPVRRSFGRRLLRTLPVHCGQHLTDVRGQQIIHFVTL